MYRRKTLPFILFLLGFLPYTPPTRRTLATLYRSIAACKFNEAWLKPKFIDRSQRASKKMFQIPLHPSASVDAHITPEGIMDEKDFYLQLLSMLSGCRRFARSVTLRTRSAMSQAKAWDHRRMKITILSKVDLRFILLHRRSFAADSVRTVGGWRSGVH